VPNLGAARSGTPPASLDYRPLSMPTGKQAELAKGLYGGPAQRRNLLTSLLASLSAKKAGKQR
jgi:hypothetical protein